MTGVLTPTVGGGGLIAEVAKSEIRYEARTIQQVPLAIRRFVFAECFRVWPRDPLSHAQHQLRLWQDSQRRVQGIRS